MACNKFPVIITAGSTSPSTGPQYVGSGSSAGWIHKDANPYPAPPDSGPEVPRPASSEASAEAVAKLRQACSILQNINAPVSVLAPLKTAIACATALSYKQSQAEHVRHKMRGWHWEGSVKLYVCKALIYEEQDNASARVRFWVVDERTDDIAVDEFKTYESACLRFKVVAGDPACNQTETMPMEYLSEYPDRGLGTTHFTKPYGI